MAFDRNAWQRVYRSTEEYKAKRREKRRVYDATPHAKDLKKECDRRHREANKEKIAECKKGYPKSTDPIAVEKRKQSKRVYRQSQKGKEKKYIYTRRAIEVASLWWVKRCMLQGTRLTAADVPKELVEIKRITMLIKREGSKQNEKRN